MPRYCCLLEYDGGFFKGWQHQPHLLTAQGCLQKALFQLTGEASTIYGSGRTDAGVHATGQVAHMDLSKSWSPETLRLGLNFHLKAIPLKVRHTIEVDLSFHARFSAKTRTYLYLILNTHSESPLYKGRVLWCSQPLALADMQNAAAQWIGHHDFSSFRKKGCQSTSSFKTLDQLCIEKKGSVIGIHIKARSFLHNQVRIMVGTLLRIGKGYWTCHDALWVLQQCDRQKNAATAPPHGLYLTQIDYDLPLFEGMAASYPQMMGVS